MKTVVLVLILVVAAGFVFADTSAPTPSASVATAPGVPFLLALGAYGLSPAGAVMAVVQAWAEQTTTLPDAPRGGLKELKRDLQKDGGGPVPWPPVQPPLPPPPQP